MEQIGQTKLYIRTNTELKGHFTVIHKKSLDKTSAPCVSDDSYRYTNCIKDYVAITAGCHLDLVDNTDYNSKDHDTCITKDQVRQIVFVQLIHIYSVLYIYTQILKYDNALTNVSKLSWTEMVKTTGCLPKCSYKQFSFEKVSTFNVPNGLTCRVPARLLNILMMKYSGRLYPLPPSSCLPSNPG